MSRFMLSEASKPGYPGSMATVIFRFEASIALTRPCTRSDPLAKDESNPMMTMFALSFASIRPCLRLEKRSRTPVPSITMLESPDTSNSGPLNDSLIW